MVEKLNSRRVKTQRGRTSAEGGNDNEIKRPSGNISATYRLHIGFIDGHGAGENLLGGRDGRADRRGWSAMTSAASGASPRRRWRPREGDSGSSSVRRGRRGVSGACCGCAKGSGARCERWSAGGTSGRSGGGSWTGQGCDGGEPGGDGQASGSGDSGCCRRRWSRDGSSRAISGGVLEFAASGSVEGFVVRVSPL